MSYSRLPIFLPSILLACTTTTTIAGPCDIFGNAGTPCVAAHSMVRALFANYSGPLYQLRRQYDNFTYDIYPLSPGGFANSTAHDEFCATCTRTIAPGIPPIGYTVNIIPMNQPTLSYRHCYSQAFVTPTDGNADHQFKLVPALNGDSNAISFQSINYPTSYIAPVTTAEPGRLGIVETPSVPDDASWTITSAPNNGVYIVLKSRNLAMTMGNNLTGICASSYTPPSVGVFMDVNNGNSNTIWTLNNAGYPPAAACQVWKFYDQSTYGNDLLVAGRAINNPNDDNPVNATRHPITVKGGLKVYGAMFESGMGYRTGNGLPGNGIAKGNEPETLYMVTSGTYVNDGCCFDYGNAESSPWNSSQFADGTMEAINFSNSDVSGYWCGGNGTKGPWVMADLENGLWACGTPATSNPNNTALPFPFVTAMVKGSDENRFVLKGNDANNGTGLLVLYDGIRPPGYYPMKKESVIILGMGGDNVNKRKYASKSKSASMTKVESTSTTQTTIGSDIPALSVGIFYEGCVTQGFATDAADLALQMDIASVGYSQ